MSKTPPVNQLTKKLCGDAFGRPMVQMVMDYREGDLAESEVKQQLNRFIPKGWAINFTQVHSFKTTETGFVAGQLALAPRTEQDPRLVLYLNCAPRKDLRSSRGNNEGEGLIYGRLKNGVELVAVNSGYSLSLLRHHFVSFRNILVDKGGSQFRSRDNFPVFVCAVCAGLDIENFLGPELDPEQTIPEFKEGFIGYIDSFGNIKTTYRTSSRFFKNVKEGDSVEVAINGTEIVAKVTTGSFNVPEGNLALAPGSSGWDDRFWEVFQRGGDASSMFKHPQVGSEVKLAKINS